MMFLLTLVHVHYGVRLVVLFIVVTLGFSYESALLVSDSSWSFPLVNYDHDHDHRSSPSPIPDHKNQL